MDTGTDLHAFISIHCPKYGHADFRVEEDHFICNHCERDFTEEMKKIYRALKQTFKK